MTTGTLYIVATPIGNLADITQRAIDVLREVHLIAAEDTRHSRKLLQHLGLHTPMTALHEHNERQQASRLIAHLQQGEDLALISDAGTPLVSDPGFVLVRMAQEAGLRVSPVPGPSAMIAALSCAGLPSDRFSFEGFLPAKGGARKKALQALARESCTLVFYESSHRIQACLQDMVDILGGERELTLAREMTKRFETIQKSTLSDWLLRLENEPDQHKGEFVLVVAGAPLQGGSDDLQLSRENLLQTLLSHVSVKTAAAIAAELTGEKKNALYKQALALSEEK